ncbi:MAG: TonB-dependent receptor [Bacteroidales bacterium]|nr:TonB-dependent receptor [Bacteroidales bacterium]
MRKTACAFILLSIVTLISAQSKITLSGCITDENGVKLIGANVIIKGLEIGTVTGIDGCFKLKLSPGTYNVIVSYIGYDGYAAEHTLTSDKFIKVKLTESSEMIEAVRVVSEAKDINVKEVKMSTEKLELKSIEKLPVVLGEPDVIKTIKLLPGVLMANEASGGFHVRGGASDQNLVLLDDATIYNPSHFVGFFSVFNSDMLDDLELIKGGIPAQYGGRLSSVLDLKVKEGNYHNYHGKASIGLISSRLVVEGPIAKDKASFIVAGRRTYADILLGLSNNSGLQGSGLFFYDLNGKMDWKVNSKNRVSFHAYSGRDALSFQDFFENKYGNTAATLKWNHRFNENFYLKTSVMYTGYKSDMSFKGFDNNKFKLETDLEDIQMKVQTTYKKDERHFITFGAEGIRHRVNPGTITSKIDTNIRVTDVIDNFSHEYAAYLSDKINITPKLAIMAGLRYSVFHNVGKSTSYEFNKENPQNYIVSDSTNYSSGEVFNVLPSGFEPRLGIRYLVDDNTSLKLSYNRMYQYIQLASNSSGSFSLEYWFSSSPNIKPQIADQVAGGIFKNFYNHQFESSLEIFYKNVQNSVDFRDHADLLFNEFYEGELRIGSLKAYGAEFMLKKRTGKLTGWISYTYSRAYKEIPEINVGDAYAAAHDKPHDLAVVVSYELTPRINVSGNWVYTSAEPRTIPVQKGTYGNDIFMIYGKRNSVRLFDYHRLDLSATMRLNKREGKYNFFANVSVYNVYNRANPYSYRWSEDPEQPNKIISQKLYIYGTVPAFSLSLEF